MKVIHTKKEIQGVLSEYRCLDNSVGLVPTMGALHEGHLDLVEKSKSDSDITVVSIFVNPTQFNDISDLEKYPRNLDHDLEKLRKVKPDFVFVPEVEEVYPEKPLVKFEFSGLGESLEGAYRPGHFNGVGIIVTKLFHILHPTHVFFGQKDLQQVAVVRRLIKDLSFDINITVVPTRRAEDGLALSSRNARLNPEERSAALILFNSLVYAKDELLKGANWFAVKEKINRRFLEEPRAKLEYVELVNSETMETVSSITPEDSCSICIAAFVGETRLIDNMTVTV